MSFWTGRRWLWFMCVFCVFRVFFFGFEGGVGMFLFFSWDI